MAQYQYWQHGRSGEVYAVRLHEDQVTGACGPLHHSDLGASALIDYYYDDEPDLIEEIRQNQDSYRLVHGIVVSGT